MVTLADPSLLVSKGEDVDELIDKNTQELQDCVQDIERLLLDLPDLAGTSFGSETIEEALNHLNEFHVLEKTCCYNLDTDELQSLFQRINDILTKWPSSEESVLRWLVKFCSQTGLSLPFQSTGTQPVGSIMSLNVVHDDGEQMCEALWDDMRQKFEHQLLSLLLELPLHDSGWIARQRREELITTLLLIMPVQQLWERYRSLRMCGLNQLINTCLSHCEEAMTFNQIVEEYKTIGRTVIVMIDSDFHLMMSGVFRKACTMWDALSSIYFEKLLDGLEIIFSDLAASVYYVHDGKSHSLTSRRASDYHITERLVTKPTKNAGREGPYTVLSGLDEAVVDSLTRLTRTLLSIERHVHSLYLTSYTGLRTISSPTRSHKPYIKGVLKCASALDVSMLNESLDSTASGSFATTVTSLHYGDTKAAYAEKPSHHNKPRFLWQETLSPFTADLIAYIERRIAEAAERCVQELANVRTTLRIVSLCQAQKGSKLEYPAAVYTAVAEFVHSFELILPLAEAGSGALQSLRSTFVLASIASLKSLLDSLYQPVQERAQAIGGQKELLYSLSSAALLRNTLYHCDVILNKDAEKQTSFLLVYHQFCQLVDSLAQEYTNAEVKFITHSLFHDSESYNWADGKEFYEGERISFPVHMWSLRMQVIRYDLWSICPPANASAILRDVLCESLDCLTLKYLSVSPSPRRVEQFRMDITAVLMVVFELMFSVCSSPSQLLDVESGVQGQPYLAIHSSCCKLLASLVLMCAPLEEIYKVYKKGLQKRGKRRRRRSPDSVDDAPGYYSHWLHWINPSIVPRGAESLRQMQTTSALYLHIRLMLAQPEMRWSKIIQALMMKDFTLPIMILTQHDLAVTQRRTTSCAPNGTTDQPVEQPCGLGFCSGKCVSHCSSTDNIFTPFLEVLARCRNTLALFNILLPVIDRSNQWSFFSKMWISLPDEVKPQWLDAVVSLLDDCLTPVIRSVTLTLCSEIAIRQHERITHSLHTAKLPCDCPTPVAEDCDTKELSLEDYVALAITEQLGETICVVLPSVCTLCDRLQAHMEAHAFGPIPNLTLQVLGYAVFRRLRNRSFIEQAIEGAASQPVLTVLYECATRVYAGLTGRAEGLPFEAQSFIAKNELFLKGITMTILRDTRSRETLTPDLQLDDSCTEEYIENCLEEVASDVLAFSTGRSYLQQIFNLIKNNQSWIFSSLDIQYSLPLRYPPRTTFAANVNNPDIKPLNPLEMFNTIGDCTLDQVTIKDHKYDWSKLLHGDLGISDLNMSHLLQHRPEFQEGAYLEEHEAKYVDCLKERFLQ